MAGAFSRLSIIGAGAWGTALGVAARRAGRDVTLWARRPDFAQILAETRENARYLPGVPLDSGLHPTASLKEAARADAVLLVVPAQHVRMSCAALAPHLRPFTPLILCAKGIELETGLLMSEVVKETLPGFPLAVLSGPTFAAEVGRGLPTAVTLACAEAGLGADLVDSLGSRTFRPYWSPDIIGAEVGGAVKNVLAIACGIVTGKGLGDNARAALITRGLAEIARLGRVLGARMETLMGLSGLGDLTLTCTSLQSRNTSLGVALGQGRALPDILAERHTVAEGVPSATALMGLAARHDVDMPICAAVNAILHQGADIDATIETLLARPFQAEVRD